MRSLLWASIYHFLLFELALTLVLCVPVPRKWRNIICMKVSKLELKRRLKIPLLTMFCILSFALIDAATYLSQAKERQQRLQDEGIIGNEGGVLERHLEKEKIYKTGRNMYLAGFALALLFVINRIAELMQEHADLEGELENLHLAMGVQSMESYAKAKAKATAPVQQPDELKKEN